MENRSSKNNLLFINTIGLSFLLINNKLLLIDNIWNLFILLFLFISNFTELINIFKTKNNENNINKKNG